MTSGVESDIARLVAPTLDAMGYDVVRVKILRGGRSTLQIMAERNDGAATTVDDCAAISRAVSAMLDVEDPMPGAYALEISTPGIDRPLVRLGDFERFAGYQAKIQTRCPIEGRRRFSGRLLGVSEGGVRIALGDEEAADIPLDNIDAAKLVLTDDLIAATNNQRRV